MKKAIAVTLVITTALLASNRAAQGIIVEKPSEAVQALLQSKFRDFTVYQFNGRQPFARPDAPELEFRLNLGTGLDWELNLNERNLLSPNYVVRGKSSTGTRLLPSAAPRTYIAHSLDGATEGRLSFDGVTVSGFLREGASTTFLEPVNRLDPTADPSLLVAYSPRDVIRPDDAHCGYIAPSQAPMPLAQEMEIKKSEPVKACRRTQIAYAVDYSMVDNYGGEAGAENRILEVLNVVEGFYDDPRVDIAYAVTEMVMEEEALGTWGRIGDGDLGDNLTALMSWSRSSQGFSNPFDVTSMWFYHRSGGTVGLAYVGSICSSTRGGHVVKDFTSSITNMAIDHAHELGHNWGSPHITSGANIMYPSISGGNTDWADESINIMVDHKDSRSCLSGCDVPPLAEFSVQQSECRPDVRFSDASSDDPTGWQWDFGDGNQSTEKDPLHTYTTNGTYNVTLSVTNDFGDHQITKQGAVTINAPDAPQILPSTCNLEEVVLNAQSDRLVKWYDQPTGGEPLSTGNSWTIPVPQSPRVVYAESSDPDGETEVVGPTDFDNGEGGFKDNGSIHMIFETSVPVKFVGITVESNAQGSRRFELSHEGAPVADTVVELGEGEFEITFNWDLYDVGEYQLELVQTETYVTNLYRNTDGVSYPQNIDDVVSITENYYHEVDPSATGWYIGHSWKFQPVGACASSRQPVSVDPGCITSVQAARNFLEYDISHLGKLRHLEVRNLQGRALISTHDVDDERALKSMLELLPKGRVFWIRLKGEQAEMTRTWMSL